MEEKIISQLFYCRLWSDRGLRYSGTYKKVREEDKWRGFRSTNLYGENGEQKA